MGKVIIYIKETCSKSRAAVQAFRDANIDVHVIDYYKEPLSSEKFLNLVEKSELPLSDFIRSKESVYEELKFESKELSDEELADVVVIHPDLIERPIIEIGDTVMIARTPEKVDEAIQMAKSFEKKKKEWERRQDWHGGKRE